MNTILAQSKYIIYRYNRIFPQSPPILLILRVFELIFNQFLLNAQN